MIELQNSAPLLTRWGTKTGNGHWNSKKIVESYSYKLVCFVTFPTGLQKLGQRTSSVRRNGHFPNVFKRKSVVSTGYFDPVTLLQTVILRSAATKNPFVMQFARDSSRSLS